MDLFSNLEPEKQQATLSNQNKEKTDHSSENFDIQFAEKFVNQGGKFIYCENIPNFFQLLKSLKKQQNWNFIFSWTTEMRALMEANDFQVDEIGFFMDNSDAAISLCDFLIADSGTLMLSPDQATNRRLVSFPSNHIILANKTNVCSDLESAIEKFNNKYSNRLPSIIELDEEKKVYKQNHTRLLNAEGTKDVFVFYVDVESFE